MPEAMSPETEFANRFASLNPGESFVYHTGNLAYDRRGHDTVRAFANQAWRLAEDGWAELTQKRVPAVMSVRGNPEDRCDYIIHRRHTPLAGGRKWRGCYAGRAATT